MTVGLPLMKNILTPSAESVLIRLALTAVASATDAAIQTQIYGSGMTSLIISKEKMKYVIEIAKYLEKPGLLNKAVSKTVENKAKEQKGEFINMLQGALGASLLINMLEDQWFIRADEWTNRTGQDFWYRLILWLILQYKNFIKTNLDLMVFMREIIYLK